MKIIFDDNFYAWNYGPVSKKVYNQYKIFGSMPITLEESVNIKRANEIFIHNLFSIFAYYSVSDLIEFSHQRSYTKIFYKKMVFWYSG